MKRIFAITAALVVLFTACASDDWNGRSFDNNPNGMNDWIESVNSLTLESSKLEIVAKMGSPDTITKSERPAKGTKWSYKDTIHIELWKYSARFRIYHGLIFGWGLVRRECMVFIFIDEELRGMIEGRNAVGFLYQLVTGKVAKSIQPDDNEGFMKIWTIALYGEEAWEDFKYSGELEKALR